MGGEAFVGVRLQIILCLRNDNFEREAGSEERGARSEERGARSEERGARSEERGREGGFGIQDSGFKDRDDAILGTLCSGHSEYN